MHEMTIATQLIDFAIAAAEKENAEKITSVDVELGQLAGVMVEAFRFCFNSIKGSTPLKSANLVIHEIKGKGTCTDCKNEISLTSLSYLCPECGCFGVQIFQGQEIQIRSITVD